MKKKNDSTMDNNQKSMVKGSAWLALASLISRVLGVIYIIPWMRGMGTNQAANLANAIYQVSYEPYSMLVEVSTVGIPIAISQQVSKYNALNDYTTSYAIVKQAFFLMAISGIISAAVLYGIAPWYASHSSIASDMVPAAVYSTRALVPAILIFPILSTLRGFIQGHQKMKEVALSQIIEQVFRVFFMLLAVYVIRVKWEGPIALAVSLSTFSAFIGAFFSLAYLLSSLKDPKYAHHRSTESNKNSDGQPTFKLLVDIIKTALPFIIISVAVTLSRQIDNFTFQPIMKQTTSLSELRIQELYAISHANANKLVNVTVSFGVAIASTTVAVISPLYIKRDFKALSQQLSLNIQMLFLIMLPVSLGLATLADSFYTLFYGQNAMGGKVLSVFALVGMMWAFYFMLANSAKAIQLVKPTLLIIFLGLGLKLLFQYPCISLLGVYGMHMSSLISFAVINLALVAMIHQDIGLQLFSCLKRVSLMAIIALTMACILIISKHLLHFILDIRPSVQAIIVLLTCIPLGCLIYFYLTLKSRLLEKILGSSFKTLRLKLRIK